MTIDTPHDILFKAVKGRRVKKPRSRRETSRRLSRSHLPRPSRIPFARGGQRRFSARSRQQFTVTGNPSVTTCRRSIDRSIDRTDATLPSRRRKVRAQHRGEKEKNELSAGEGRAIGTRNYAVKRDEMRPRELQVRTKALSQSSGTV